MTGPVCDVIFMGMANGKQKGEGIHMRLRSRAFVAFDPATKKRWAFVSIDAGMGSQVLKNRVVAALEKELPGVYTVENVAISGTHTHSGPSGFLQDVIFQFAGSGWQPQTINAFTDGVTQSILQAHKNLQAGTATVSQGTVEGANINRSPTSYLLNPADERAKYNSDTDHQIVQMNFKTTEGEPIGLANWYAVHGTSMNNTNKLISGDNKGWASYLMEREINGPTSKVKPGLGKFVAAFAATNLGDVSPNTAGPKCRDTGLPCDDLHSTCNGKTAQCSAFGPGKDMFESTEIIATKQFDVAKQLFSSSSTAMELKGEVDFVHRYIKMPGLRVDSANASLCVAAVGDSFAAGTTDGPGEFDFTQGNTTNPIWNMIASVLHKATPEEKACQAPKPILLTTGDYTFPDPWAPSILPIQLLRLGQLVIISIPTEMTTMAGRRMRKAVKDALVQEGVLDEKNGVTVIAGLSNTYADYTTTFEEYQGQRYEAASTIYGPHQLAAYTQEFQKIAVAMAKGINPRSGLIPQDFSAHIHNVIPVRLYR
jgi:neutral ceramidase